MKPSSIVSTPEITFAKPSFASKVGGTATIYLRPDVMATSEDSMMDEVPVGALSVYENIDVCEGVFNVVNVGAMRQEIEVSLETLNGERFHGSISHNEAKFIIFKQCMGFEDFSNFDGVRLGYKGNPVVVFKLKTAINVDELLHVQHFEFKRRSVREGRPHTDTIGCKIRGLRKPGPE